MLPTATRSRVLLALAVVSALCGACGAGASGGAAAEAQAPKPPLGKGTPAQNLSNAYLVAQAKLARDDFAGARSAFGNVQAAVKATGLPMTAELVKQLEAAAVEGGAAPDIAHLRTIFARLSEAMLVWFKTQPNPLTDPLIVAHCPMALEGKGARWLQTGKQLRNPYYGAEMLTCGSTEATLAPNKTL